MSDHDKDELARRVAAAYDEVLDEPVPDRLAALLAPPPVAELAAARQRREGRQRRAGDEARERRGWGWAEWGGMAASLMLGLLLGTQLLARRPALLAERDGAVVAGQALAQALDDALAADPAGAVRVQLSFRDTAGRFCRTFSAGALAGLACREGTQWSVVATAQSGAGAEAGGMRQAGSALPRPVLDAVDARIQGTALDAAQERAARDRHWQR